MPTVHFRLFSVCVLWGSVCAASAGAAAFDAGPAGVTLRETGTALDGLTAFTELAGCQMQGEVEVRDLPGGGREFRSTLADPTQTHRCVLVNRYTESPAGLRWEIEVVGDGGPWTAPIHTVLRWPRTEGLTWWTAWGDPRPDAPWGVREGPEDETSWWSDPLVAVPFADATYYYGGQDHNQPQAFAIPMVTVLDGAVDRGVSVVLSPEDLILDMALKVTADGSMTLSRTAHRISSERPVRFALDLVCHEGDWRAGLGWMVDRYRAYFDPPNPNVHTLAGCGAYSSHSRDIDGNRLRRMAFRVNWKASFDFPYMGMFIPPVPDDTTEWIDFKSNPNSIRRMREDIRCFTDQGFYVLSYFNVTEFGAYIQYPPPPRKAVDDADLWRDPNDFVYHVLGDAILKRWDSDAPFVSWEGCIAMDPGEPVYQEFLLDQAQRHIEAFPESSGICIDRMDWLRFYNPNFDDGVSWVNNAPARSLVVSWHEIIAKLGDVFHKHDKVIYCNPHYRRVDLLRHIDGIYDEFGQMGHSMNLCALLALRKPVMAWTIPVPELVKAPDRYFQRHLHMGSYLTAPLPGNDHTILPSEELDPFYLDYGPLLDALRGKEWVLKPHAVSVENNAAKANIFSVPDGYVVPVTFGPATGRVRVTLRHLEGLSEGASARVIHPGKTEWEPLDWTREGDGVAVDVPLERGCAMVRIASEG